MPAFHQMGHDSANLLSDPCLLRFYKGAFLSPVNTASKRMDGFVDRVRNDAPNLELIFDPQLYFPNSTRGELTSWSYFPSDVDTADTGSTVWWEEVIRRLARTITDVQPDAACSPAVVPKLWRNEYYQLMVDVCEQLANLVKHREILQTVIVDMDDICARDRPEEIASIVSGSIAERVFLVICSDVDPRREFSDSDGLKGVMRFIKKLEDAGQRVTVGFASTDVALWKAAGAHSCATGKFFNLRRFARSRFEEPGGGGGGQMPYWVEEQLFAFLRSPDVLRVRRELGLSDASTRNPQSESILSRIENNSDNRWVAESWRHYLWWFADFERRATRSLVRSSLEVAERAWTRLQDASVLFDEPRNDGSWLRPWRQAEAEFDR